MRYDALIQPRSFTGHTEYAGIDKIRISYPLDKEYSDGSDDLFTKHGVYKTLRNGSKLQYAKGHVPGPNGDTTYFEIRNNASMAYIEFNPSRSIDPEGTTLCAPDQVEDLIQKGRDLERIVLSRAVRWHVENRILLYANKTVIFD